MPSAHAAAMVRNDVVERAIAAARRHPFAAVLVGVAVGWAALAITDRLTRKW